MPFVPTGYLTLTAAIDRVVELRQGVDGSPLLTEDERATLRNWQRWRVQLSRPEPKPGRPDVTLEEIKDLLEKETLFKEQQRAAGEVLRQLLYAGRVPSEMITREGPRIETPQYIWGGGQWREALSLKEITFRPSILSVTGFPIILLDALEAAFNPDGTVKEEPQPGPAAQNLQLNKGGRRPASQSKREEILAEFDKLPLTFKRGELAAISEVIAKKSGYKQNTVEGILRPGYKELEQKQGSK